MLLILNGFLNDGSDSIYQFEFDADSFEGQHNVGEENCGVYSKVGDSVGCDFCRQFRGLAYRENVMLCSDLLIAFEISAWLSDRPDSRVLFLFRPLLSCERQSAIPKAINSSKKCEEHSSA